MRGRGASAARAAVPGVAGGGRPAVCIDLSFAFCSYAPNRCRVGRMADNLLPLVGAIVLAGLATLAVLVVIALRALRRRDAQDADKQLRELARLQAETAVRVEAMRDMLAGRQAE